MPFGLHGAPTTFQWLRNSVFTWWIVYLYGQYAAAYLDDVVLITEPWTTMCHLFDFRESGTEEPVLFLNWKLFERKQTIEKDGLANKWAIDFLRYYLLVCKFTSKTNHRALKWRQSLHNSNSTIMCWCLALQPYQFTIGHCPGKKNLTANC